MKQTRLLMGMPITIEVVDPTVTQDDLDKVFAYFVSVDETFSTYKATSEISKINRGELFAAQYSEDMEAILALSEQTKRDTYGYFDIQHDGIYDPSGIVKGWAIQNATYILKAGGLHNFYIDAGGDIQVSGNKDGKLWRIGIRNPFNHAEHVKVLALTNRGVATSGTAIRGQHIYDPYNRGTPLLDIVSITVIGPNIYEADRFATAAFAMGKRGIQFIERLAGFEGYMIDAHARATFTSGLERDGRTQIVGAQIAGDFTLPSNPKQKLVFIAGGIGITPFRSMLKYLLDVRQRRDIVLFYANRAADEIVYKDVLSTAQGKLGIKTFYTLTDTAAIPRNWSGLVGRISEQMIQEAVPDYKERIFYLSGPPDMVRGYEHVLKNMHVKNDQIKKDFFPGLV